MTPVLEVVNPGMGVALQDGGRPGWKRFGVPPGGAMDRYSAAWANRLVGNSLDEPVLEVLLQGTELRALSDCRVAVAGAAVELRGGAVWVGHDLRVGDLLVWRRARTGVWSYVAVAGGFQAERWLGSAGVSVRSGIGRMLRVGDVLERAGCPAALHQHTARAWAGWQVRRNFGAPPVLPVWPGPQWNDFDLLEQECFFSGEWEVSPRSDRTGYRLTGACLNPPEGGMPSEPVLVGSIQVPPNGQPIVTLRDGPTVGGYPKIGLVDAGALDWLVQCQPGVPVRFALAG